MKKMLSLLLVFCLCLTLCGCNPKDILSSLLPEKGDAYLRDAKIYNDYLINGGIDELTKEWLEYSEPEEWKIETCMVDLNDDGCYELYVSLTENPILMVTNQFLLAIKDDEVEIILSASHGGGSMGGETLSLYYDTETQKYVLFYLSSFRDGDRYGSATRKIYTYDGNDIVTLKEFYILSIKLENEYEDYIEKMNEIKQENDLYSTDEYNFYSYKIDGEYVSEEEYNNALERYIVPEDENFKPKEGTLDNPLNLEEDTDTSSDESEAQSKETSSIESEDTTISQPTHSTPTPSKPEAVQYTGYYPSEFLGLTFKEIKGKLGTDYEDTYIGLSGLHITFANVPFIFEYSAYESMNKGYIESYNEDNITAELFENTPVDIIRIKEPMQKIQLFPNYPYTNQMTYNELKTQAHFAPAPTEGKDGICSYFDVDGVSVFYQWSFYNYSDDNIPEAVYIYYN